MLLSYHDQVTIAIPFRADSSQRKRNLTLLLRHLMPLESRIVLLEADTSDCCMECKEVETLEYLFVYDPDAVFHKTRYINQLLEYCQTSIVVIWDADIILPYEQLETAVKAIVEQRYIVSIPYNRIVWTLNAKQSIDYEESGEGYFYLLNRTQCYSQMMGKCSCGGVLVVNREGYLKCGGDNEKLYGWGPEDVERIHRMEILGYPVYWVNSGPLFHLWHPRGKNSWFISEELAFANRVELIRVCNMEREELVEYINSWRK